MEKIETPKEYNKRRWAELQSVFYEQWLTDSTAYREHYEQLRAKSDR
jgi:hypothetical protein